MQHFIYSLLNILNEMSPYILLGFLVAGLMHAYIDNRLMARHLSGHGIRPVLKAALFGIPLPLCSCGVLPAAVSLYRRGASKGATASFLIATPQTGVDSIAATYSLLGLPFAILRPLAALIGSLAGGLAVDRIDKLALPMYSVEDESTVDGPKRNFLSSVADALRYGFVDMVGSVGKWLVVGLLVAAVITVAVPTSFFTGLSEYPLLAMLAMVIVAVPMYICATGSIPIALSLMMKGLSPGVAFVMLMAGPAANFASVIVLSKTIGRKAASIYIASVVITSIAFGLLIDLLLPRQWFIVPEAVQLHECHIDASSFTLACSAILVCLLIYSFIKNKRHLHTHNIETMNKVVYSIEGMACVHCKNNVEKALSALPGVMSVEVDLANKTAVVDGVVDENLVKDAVEKAGYTFCGVSVTNL